MGLGWSRSVREITGKISTEFGSPAQPSRLCCNCRMPDFFTGITSDSCLLSFSLTKCLKMQIHNAARGSSWKL